MIKDLIQMIELFEIVLLTLFAGLAMPLGALLARIEHIRPRWLENEFRHFVIAFGGGALLAAVALVLVPEGMKGLSIGMVVLSFSAGAISLMWLDIYLTQKKTSASQLVAMLSDFIPEAIALGATFASSHSVGFLLAGIIALQNLPEGFNAYRELRCTTHFRSRSIIRIFTLMALLGPICGVVGFYYLAEQTELLSGIMLFSAGGILYLIFQDIAPQAKLEKHWIPSLGAVMGFLLGVVGAILVGHH